MQIKEFSYKNHANKRISFSIQKSITVPKMFQHFLYFAKCYHTVVPLKFLFSFVFSNSSILFKFLRKEVEYILRTHNHTCLNFALRPGYQF